MLIHPVDRTFFFNKALQFAGQYTHYAFLHPHHYPDGFHKMLAIGCRRKATPAAEAFTGLSLFAEKGALPTICCLGYDLKNQTEQLSSRHDDHIGFPEALFFEPEILITENQEGEMHIHHETPEVIFDKIEKTAPATAKGQDITLKSRLSSDQYIDIIHKIRQHIIRGDLYEMNFCNEFYAKNISLDPVSCFLQLTAKSPMPFACLVKAGEHVVISASPERFMKHENGHLMSQPIKGTIRRGQTPEEDNQLRHQLLHDEKERAENLMIVDLVRNDLAKSCLPGSIQVDELFGIHTFPRVHQMISTISGKMRPGILPGNAIKNAFPMGSMTGAPKIKAMELIEQYESFKRGIFSGAIGYYTPEGDFDLNVIIRSLIYHAGSNYLSLPVGSAITYDAIAEEEWKECLIKRDSVLNMLNDP